MLSIGGGMNPAMMQYIQQLQMQGIPAGSAQAMPQQPQQMAQPIMQGPLQQGAPSAGMAPAGMSGGGMSPAGMPPQGAAPMQGLVQPQHPMGGPMMGAPQGMPQGAPQQGQPQQGGMMNQLFSNPQVAQQLANAVKVGQFSNQVGPGAGGVAPTASLVAHQGGNPSGNSGVANAMGWLSMMRNGLGSGIGGNG